MSSRMRHVISNDNPETLAISQFYANYCNPTNTAITAIATATVTTTTTATTTIAATTKATAPTTVMTPTTVIAPTTAAAAITKGRAATTTTVATAIMTTTTATTTAKTVTMVTKSVIPTEVTTELRSKQSEPCLYGRNRSILAKTLNSAIHRLSLPGVSHHPEFHFITPIVNHKRFTIKNNSFPDLTQKMADGKHTLQNNECSKRVTVIDRPGQDKIHYTGARIKHRIVDVLKEFVSFYNSLNILFS
ncbi:unnamed protein product [Cercopithifilaria johnstoni]|uniref:Uncharacterized protein n=1 Tax=Cercopithifilaria johnstoni TaxID=2874296 RepID=A0A8J2LW16_9BILA|nr:unnamed protein product [Cercopithifilaria johnstoni]